MNKRCWICGAEADSSEHRLKKTDLVRAHGRGPYRGPTALAYYYKDKESLIQGPDSNVIKYSHNLCQRCNTTYTQPFDRAYDQFIDWIMKNEEAILHRRYVDFHDLYGRDWENSQRNLYKYFAKSFGCRLIYSGAKVPSDIVTLLGKDKFRTALRITIAVNEDILLMPSKDRDGFIGKGALQEWAPSKPSGIPYSFTWDEYVSWITICYWYNYMPIGRYGSTWVANNQFVYMGSFSPLNKKMRADFLEKIKKRDEHT